MSVSTLSKDLGPRYFSVPQPFGKMGGLGAPAAADSKGSDEASGKTQAGVSVTISSDALAAYDASLARLESSAAVTMDEDAPFGAGYELRRVMQRDAAGYELSEPQPEALTGIGTAENMDQGSVLMSLEGVNGGQAVRTEDLSKVADMALEDVRQKLDQAFALQNLSNTPLVSLSFDPMGNLVVGEHPDRMKIEALFGENEDLANEVRTAHALKDNAMTWEKASLHTTARDQASQLMGADAAEGVTELFLAMGDEEADLKYGPSSLELSYNGESPKDHLASIASRLGLGAAA